MTTTPVKNAFFVACVLAVAGLTGCEKPPEGTPVLEALNTTLSSMHVVVDELNDQVAEISRQFTEAREAPSAAGANALRLAGECQASLIATSLVYEASESDGKMPSRNIEAESRDVKLVSQWRERHGIGDERFEAAVGVAMLGFLERHRTYSVTESAEDDAGRMVELNKLHDACEAMRLFARDVGGNGSDS